MPIIEFMCKSCGHIFEEITSSLTTCVPCPHCETDTAYKLPSLPAVARGSFGTVPRAPKHTTSAVRNARLKSDFNKGK